MIAARIMHQRRILSLWFPRLAAERFLRLDRRLPAGPFAVVGEVGNAQMLVSVSSEAEATGLRRGQPLRDARAMCPELVTKLTNPQLDPIGKIPEFKFCAAKLSRATASLEAAE